MVERHGVITLYDFSVISKVIYNCFISLGSRIRDSGGFTTYNCSHLSDTEPEPERSICTIYDDQFRTLIEHGDW